MDKGSTVLNTYKERIRAGQSGLIRQSALTVPAAWQGFECQAHVDVLVGEDWQRELSLPFKVEDVGVCPL